MIKTKQKTLHDIVEVEDDRTINGEKIFKHLYPLRDFRGNYGVPRVLRDEVIKGFFKSDSKTLDKLDILHEAYVSEVKKFMDVVDYNIIKSNNLYLIKQPLIVGYTFEDYIKKETPKNIIATYKTLLKNALELVCSSDKVIGIDQKPENYMKSHSSDHTNPTSDWKLVDTFPPFISTDKINFGEIFNLRTYEKEFSSNPNDSFFREPKRVARRFCLKSELFTNLDLCDATMDVLKQYDPKIVNYWGMFRRRSSKK